MKKLLAMMLMLLPILTLVGCRQDVGLGGIDMGDSEEEVTEFFNSQGAAIEPRYDEWIRATGTIRLWKMDWDRVGCQFENDRMIHIGLIKPLHKIDNAFINYLDASLEAQFGDCFARAKEQVKVFGSENKWNKYVAGYHFDFDNDQFYLMFKEKK